MNILLTRPDIFNQRLARQLPAAFTAISFPCLAITAPQQITLADVLTRKLAQASLIIFTSPTSVVCAKRAYPDLDLNNALIYCVGAGSANSVKKHFQRQAHFPTVANSQRLIKLLVADQVDVSNTVIFTGEAGNMCLADWLEPRSRALDIVYTHRRQCPQYTQLDWQVDTIDASVCCSEQTLKNFDQLIQQNQLQGLYQLPLIVITEAMRQQALDYGFKSAIIIADGASDSAIITAIQQL